MLLRLLKIYRRSVSLHVRHYAKKIPNTSVLTVARPSNIVPVREDRANQRISDERETLKRYPLDFKFINELQWLSEGLLSCVDSIDSQCPAAPVIRLQHQSISASNLQKQLAKVMAARLDAAFLEITSEQLRNVELSRIGKDLHSGREKEETGKDVSAMAISTIIALQEQEMANGLYAFNKNIKNGKRKRRPNHPQDNAPTDFVLYTIPSLNEILEAFAAENPKQETLLIYLPDYDELMSAPRDRKLFGEFADNFNRGIRRTVFVAPGYSGHPDKAGESLGSQAILNGDFKLSSNSAGALQAAAPSLHLESGSKYGPLWQPLPSSLSIQDRALIITIPKPSDPRRAMTLRQSLSKDEEALLHEFNLKSLVDIMDEMAIKNDIDLDTARIEGLGQRARSRNDLSRIALAAQGIAKENPVIEEHVVRVLAAHSPPMSVDTDDSLSARFANLISVDQLNNYEKQLLRSCVTTPDMLETRFADVAGAEAVKRTLDDLISKPIRHPHLFARGILKASRSGILLFGPPGTGKTMLARAVAAESGATFITIGPADLNSKWVGEGEKFARAVFTLARKLAPSVIFLDEIDALLESRDTASARSSKVDILSELMSQWDGMWDVDNSHLVVMGATNRPYALDAACLRRLPRRLLVDLPAADGRIEILKILLRDDKLDGGLSLQELAAKTDSFSGSDLKHLCQAAALIAANEQSELARIDRLVLGRGHFEEALTRVSSSVSSSAPAVVKLRRWNTMYGLAAERMDNNVGF